MSYSGGLGETYNMAVSGPNVGLQSLQNKLFRAGLLTAGAFTPGRWDAATAAAVNAAAALLGHQTLDCADCAPGDAFAARADQTYSVFLDLLTKIDTLPPAAPGSITVKTPDSPAPATSKVPWLLIGGGVAVVAVGAAAYFMMRKPKAVAANARKRDQRKALHDRMLRDAAVIGLKRRKGEKQRDFLGRIRQQIGYWEP